MLTIFRAKGIYGLSILDALVFLKAPLTADRMNTRHEKKTLDASACFDIFMYLSARDGAGF